jgi:hypothetical protein
MCRQEIYVNVTVCLKATPEEEAIETKIKTPQKTIFAKS